MKLKYGEKLSNSRYFMFEACNLGSSPAPRLGLRVGGMGEWDRALPIVAPEATGASTGGGATSSSSFSSSNTGA